MDNQRALELITNSFIAAEKIREIRMQKNTRSEHDNRSISNIELIFDVLKIISDYSPGKYRMPLSRATNQGMRFFETFTNLRRHVSSLEKPRLRSRNFVSTLKVLKPVLRPNDAVIADKIIKIYEVLNS